MRHCHQLYRFVMGMLGFSLALGLAACGGGGGGSDSGTASAPTGRVALLLTDATTDDFTSIELTVTKIELLSEDLGIHPIWYGSEKIDLLDLSEHAELFAVGEVPAGLYDKMRLHVGEDSLVLVAKDPATETDYRLPGSKIDLNPRGKFEVTPGEVLYVEMDFDANKTLAFSKGGIFRPVAFVTVLEPDDGSVDDAQKLTRIRGEIESVGTDSFVLCHPNVTTADYCAPVLLGSLTSVFKDEGGTLVTGSVLAGDVSQTAVAYGRVDLEAHALDAVVVAVGDTFLTRPLRGEILAVDEMNETLSFLLEDDRVAAEGPLTVGYGLARFFKCSGAELTEAEIAALPGLLTGRDARVDGLYDAEAQTLQATMVIVKVCEEAEGREGTIADDPDPVELRARVRMEVKGSPTEPIEFCAQFSVGTSILRERTSASVESGYELVPSTFGELGRGQRVDLFGQEVPGQECLGLQRFDVSTAIVEAPSGN